MRSQSLFFALILALCCSIAAQAQPLYYNGDVNGSSSIPGTLKRSPLNSLERATAQGRTILSDGFGNQRWTDYVYIQPTAIGFTPTPTGNTTNLSSFVTTPAADVYYIDWAGRAVRLYSAAAGGDKDWLNISDNQIPQAVTNAIYNRNYAAVGARYLWPGTGVHFLVADSTNESVAVNAGNRGARYTLYNYTAGQGASYGLAGSGLQILGLNGTNNLSIGTAAGTNPAAPSAPFVNHFEVNFGEQYVRMNFYPRTRVDTNTALNYLYTDELGIVRSKSSASLVPGAAGSYVDDAAAAAGGVAIGQLYYLSVGNPYGQPAGTPKKRTAWLWLLLAAPAGRLRAPGRLARRALLATCFLLLLVLRSKAQIVGGAGVCAVKGDPNSIPTLRYQAPANECLVAVDTVTGIRYRYDGTRVAGSRWIVDNANSGGLVDTLARTVYSESTTPNYLWRYAQGPINGQKKRVMLLGDSYFDVPGFFPYYLVEKSAQDGPVLGGTFSLSNNASVGTLPAVFNGTWTRTPFATYSGVDGYSASSSTPGNSIVFQTVATSVSENIGSATRIKIFSLNNSAVFRVRINAASWDTVTTTTGNTANVFQRSGLVVGTKTVEIEVLSGTVTILGGTFQNDATAVQTSIFKAGLSGSVTASWKDLVRKPSWIEQVRQIDPDVIFVHIGLNDNAAGVSVTQITANIDTIVSSIRTSFLDTVDVVLIAPIAPIPSYTTSSPLLLRNAYSKYAVEKGIGFVSFYDMFKGSYNWALNSNLLDGTGIHPNSNGAPYLAGGCWKVLNSGYNYNSAIGPEGGIQFSKNRFLSTNDSLRVHSGTILGLNIGTGSNAHTGYRLTLKGNATGVGAMNVLNSANQSVYEINPDGFVTMKSYTTPNGILLKSFLPANTGDFNLRPRTSAIGAPADFEMVLNGRLFTNAYEFILTGGGGMNITGGGTFTSTVSASNYKNNSKNYYFLSSNTDEKWIANATESEAKAAIVFKPTGSWNRQSIGFALNNAASLTPVTSADSKFWINPDGTLNTVGKMSIGSTVFTPTALLHLAAGGASPNSASLKFSLTGAGLLSIPEPGALEPFVNSLYYTGSDAVRRSIFIREQANGATIGQKLTWTGAAWTPTQDTTYQSFNSTTLSWPLSSGISGPYWVCPRNLAGQRVVHVGYRAIGAGSANYDVQLQRITTGGTASNFGSVTFASGDVYKTATPGQVLAEGDILIVNYGGTASGPPTGLSVSLMIAP